MQQLQERPYLVNTQSHMGWSVLHQAAYHGMSQGILARLLQLKASPELKTNDGKTAVMILAETHPESQLSLPGSHAAPALQPGMRVRVHAVDGAFSGIVAAVAAESGTATVTCDTGERDFPFWRLCPETALPEGDGAGLDTACCICITSPVSPFWRLSSTCSGSPHPMCGDCMAGFLWSQFTTFRIPMKCSICNAPVEPAELRLRSLMAAWPPGQRWGNPCTALPFDQFVQNVAERLQERESIENLEFKLQWLAASGPTDRPIAYCDVAGAPKYRGCPNCAVVIEYVSACKHMTCAKCNHRFCWLCLKSAAEHNSSTYDWSVAHVCPLAPIQTELPVVPE